MALTQLKVVTDNSDVSSPKITFELVYDIYEHYHEDSISVEALKYLSLIRDT